MGWGGGDFTCCGSPDVVPVTTMVGCVCVCVWGGELTNCGRPIVVLVTVTVRDVCVRGGGASPTVEVLS